MLGLIGALPRPSHFMPAHRVDATNLPPQRPPAVDSFVDHSPEQPRAEPTGDFQAIEPKIGPHESLLDRVEEILRDEHGVAAVVRVMKPTYTKPAPLEVLEGLRFVDGVIEALAD